MGSYKSMGLHTETVLLDGFFELLISPPSGEMCFRPHTEANWVASNDGYYIYIAYLHVSKNLHHITNEVHYKLAVCSIVQSGL